MPPHQQNEAYIVELIKDARVGKTPELGSATCAAGLASCLQIDGRSMQHACKGIHKDPNLFASRLDALYPTENVNLQLGICILLHDLARADTRLRKMFSTSAAVPFLLRLLTSSQTEVSLHALALLSILTFSGSPSEALPLSKLIARPVVALALEQKIPKKNVAGDNRRWKMILDILGRGNFVFDADEGGDGCGVGMEELTRVFHRAVEDPNVFSRMLFLLLLTFCAHSDPLTHTPSLLALTTLLINNSRPALKCPSLLRLLVGQMLRHPSPILRMRSSFALTMLSTPRVDTVGDGSMEDLRAAATENTRMNVGRLLEGLPKLGDDEELKRVMGDCAEDSEVREGLVCAKDFKRAMHEVFVTRDFAQLGDVLHPLIIRCETALTDGRFLELSDTPHVFTGEREYKTAKGDLVSYVETLPLAAAALRERDGQDSLEAVVIELKYMMSRGMLSEMHETARKALEKHPKEPYIHYSLSASNQNYDEALRASKQGLMLKPKGWLLQALHQTAAINASVVGFSCINDGYIDYCTQEQRYELALAHFRSALNDQEAFMRIAPPDARSGRYVSLCYAQLLPPIKGDCTKEDLKLATERLRIMDKISKVLYEDKPPRILERRCWEIVDNHWDEAVKEWEPVFARFEKSAKLQLVDMDEQGGNVMGEIMAKRTTAARPKTTDNPDLGRYLCSYCGNTSAKLLKCSRCDSARYCNVSCQRRAWKEGHKKSCGASN